MAICAPTTSWWWNDTPPPGSWRRVARLADVVQQRGQAQHQVGPVLLQAHGPLEHLQRVLVHVLVLVVLVDLQAQAGQLGQHVPGQAGVDEQLEPAAGPAAQQELAQLLLLALRR